MQNKITFFTLLLLFVGTLHAQTDWSRYDAIVDTRSNDPQELSEMITQSFYSPKEKVEAIYYWMTHNIAYDLKLLEKRQKEGSKNGKPETYTVAELEAKKADEIEDALRKKKGVCQHYALTFQALCQAADIPCEFVGGWSKSNPELTTSKGGKHAWNVVDWGDGWKLVDPTYGAGGGLNGKFVFEFEPGFFATDPAIFAMNHYPKETKWQLLENANTEADYIAFPILGKSFYKQNLTALHPQKNTIEFKSGEAVTVEFTSPNDVENLRCSNLRTQKAINCKVNREGYQYQVTLPGERLRSGLYAFWHDGQPLFFYRLKMR